MIEPSEKEILDWLEKQTYIIVERFYQADKAARTEQENKSGGYGDKINFFTEKTKLIEGVPNIREAVKIALERERNDASKTS